MDVAADRLTADRYLVTLQYNDFVYILLQPLITLQYNVDLI